MKPKARPSGLTPGAGDNAVNQYLDWVSGEMKTHYAINLRIVRLADAADAVKRIQTESAAGRKTDGSVDLLWVNGENFRTLKEAGLLQTHWAETLPNWRYVDTRKPVREDFSMPTQGAESPWGGAQLTFIANRDITPQPPQSPQALLAFAKAHPGTVTYPRPPDFTGTAFLEQLLLALTPQPDALKVAPDDATFDSVTAPLWAYLDALHPSLWRKGKDFPPSPARMDALLQAGSLRLSLTFNPAHAQQKNRQRRAAQNQLQFRLFTRHDWQRAFCHDPGERPRQRRRKGGCQFPALPRRAVAQSRSGVLGRSFRA
ncbi:putative ABC transporter solute-binding protein [Citrobacter koseri]|uniref:Putative ABC transporter solute-binding protein n=1 Tax=Citrobacter koseri TaxID=545 RepID=A0A2X2W7Y7_CITKO|nr:putative ABC transporter solute-binding protein [Citrobacter koseri]